MKRHTQVLCGLVLASMLLPLGGCLGRSQGTTEIKTSHGKIPVRREASNVVDMAQPTVEIEGERVLVTGNIRLRGNYVNPDARVQISVIDKYGQVVQKIPANLMETDEDRIQTYRVKFGPIPARGSSLLVAYDDYRPIANYSAEYIGSGGGGAVGGRRGGGSAAVNNRGVGTRNSRIR